MYIAERIIERCFKWRYDRRSDYCNLSNRKLTRKKFRGVRCKFVRKKCRDLNGIRTSRSILQVNLQLLKLQSPLGRSYLHLNLYFRSSHHLHSIKDVIYKICTCIKYKVKVKNDRRSKFSNLSNWKEEARKKNQGFNGIRTRDLCVTGALLYQLSYEATHWERGQFIEFISPVRSEMIWNIWNNSFVFIKNCKYKDYNMWKSHSIKILASNELNTL